MTHRFANILLVEDDVGDAFLALSVLRDLGLERHARVLNTGAQALDWLFRRGQFADRPPGNPTVIILDIKLPGISGLDVLAALRAEPALKFVAVVVFSASNQERDLQRAYELGANAYVVKDIDFAAYKARLAALIQFWGVANEPHRSAVGA